MGSAQVDGKGQAYIHRRDHRLPAAVKIESSLPAANQKGLTIFFRTWNLLFFFVAFPG